MGSYTVDEVPNHNGKKYVTLVVEITEKRQGAGILVTFEATRLG